MDLFIQSNDTNGDTIGFRLSRKRDKPASKHFFRKALRQPHVIKPRVISADKYAATEYAIIKELEELPKLYYKVKKIIVSNYNDSNRDLSNVALRPFESVVYEIN